MSRPRSRTNSKWHKVLILGNCDEVQREYELDSLGQLKERLTKQRRRNLNELLKVVKEDAGKKNHPFVLPQINLTALNPTSQLESNSHLDLFGSFDQPDMVDSLNLNGNELTLENERLDSATNLNNNPVENQNDFCSDYVYVTDMGAPSFEEEDMIFPSYGFSDPFEFELSL